jgi:hypothetical protein
MKASKKGIQQKEKKKRKNENRIDRWKDGRRKDERMEGWTDEGKVGRMDGWKNGWTNGWADTHKKQMNKLGSK